MGYVVPDLGIGWYSVETPQGVRWYLKVFAAQGLPAFYRAFTVGPELAPRTGTAQAVAVALVAAAGDGMAAFVDALGDVPTPNSGTWPGVSALDWWDTIPSDVREDALAQVASWATANALP